MQFSEFLKKTQGYIFGLAALMFVIFFAGLFFPSNTTITVQKTSTLPPADIYDVVARAGSWTEWSPLSPDGSGFRFRTSGSPNGVGSVLECSHNGEHLLTLSITETRPGFMVAYDMESTQHPRQSSGIFEMEIVEQKTLIIWHHSTNWTSNPILKIVGSFMTRRQKADMENSLQRLVEYAEN